MPRQTPVRIACASAFWGDTPFAVDQLLRERALDYIVFDYLSEVTMTILAKQKKRDPHTGYCTDFLTDVIQPHLTEIARRKIRLIANAGGMNPIALAAKIREQASQNGLKIRVASVSGDDLLEGGRVRGSYASANAYLGARGVAEALARGADIVVTGRIVDSALVLGPAVHEFGWSWDDYDRLAQASLAGHIIECGTQCTGGNFTDWEKVPGRENVGFPIAEIGPAGEVAVTKAENTGGLVSHATVAEQVVYEIGDPRAYLLPDVICDFTGVMLHDKGGNRVEVSGARGKAPSGSYKVCATKIEGFKINTTVAIEGGEARKKASSVGETVLERAKRFLTQKGFSPFTETRVEAFGDGTQALLRISATHEKAEALEILAKEIAPAATSLAPGLCNLLGGRAQAIPRIRLETFLVDKKLCQAIVDDDQGQVRVPDAP